MSIDLDRADAFIERVDRLVDHRHQDAVDDEGREVLGVGDVLAEPLDDADGGVVGFLVGRKAADHLDQAHQRDRVHEVKADETFGTVRRRAEPRDRDRRRVGRQHRALAQLGAQVVEDLALDVFLLRRRFDREIDIAELGKRCGRADAFEGRVAGLLGNHLAVDLAVQVALDGLETRFQTLCGDVVQKHVEPGQRADVRNAVTHLACADDPDGANAGHAVLRSSLNSTGGGR